jgi:hypothetical protein
LVNKEIARAFGKMLADSSGISKNCAKEDDSQQNFE